VVITDPADNTGGGALGDTTTMLAVLVEHRHEVDGLVITSLPDKDAIDQIVAHQVGDTVDVKVGGKLDTLFSEPLPIIARIEVMTTGPITDDGQFGFDPLVEVGRIVLLSIDNVRLVLTDMPIKGPQPSLFRKVGIEPFNAKIVGLKTGTGYQQTYAHATKAMFVADCPGAMSYNTPSLDFKKVKRPIFPLDMDCQWEPTP
jgi:microcystin degradation protein MlrC